MKKKIVFICNSVTFAHPVRSILLANTLDQNTYDVVLYRSKEYEDLLPQCNVEVKTVWSLAPHEFFKRLYNIKPIFDKVVTERYIDDELAILKEEKPDLVIGDFRATLQITARKLSVPYLTVSNAVWEESSHVPFFSPPSNQFTWVPQVYKDFLMNTIPGAILGPVNRDLNKARTVSGLPSFGGNVKKLYSDSDFAMYCDLPSVFPEAKTSNRSFFIGPVIWQAPLPVPDLSTFIKNGKYTVYINLGSSGDGSILEELCLLLSQKNINLIVATAGGHLSPLLKEKDNVIIENYLPTDAVSKIADVVVCNGGSSTVNTVLRGGAYCIGLCTNLDQTMNMGQVEKYGLGARFLNTQKSIPRIVKLICSHPRLSEAQKQKLIEEYKKYDPEKLFPLYIEKILAHATT